MPISEAGEATTAEDVLRAAGQQSSPLYVVFFASGQPPWCPDCRHALPALERVFAGHTASTPTLLKVLIGAREAWKTPANKWRGSPFNVDQTPTVLKLVDGEEAGRLGDQDSQSEDKLRAFLDT